MSRVDPFWHLWGNGLFPACFGILGIRVLSGGFLEIEGAVRFVLGQALIIRKSDLGAHFEVHFSSTFWSTFRSPFETLSDTF